MLIKGECANWSRSDCTADEKGGNYHIGLLQKVPDYAANKRNGTSLMSKATILQFVEAF